MTIHELMIGNFVQSKTKTIVVVKAIYHEQMIECGNFGDDYDDYSPYPEDMEGVPLTEKRLLDFGFENWGDKVINEYETHTEYCIRNFIDGTSDLKVCLNKSTYGNSLHEQWIIKIDNETVYTYYSLDFVHQLQNLIYAISQKELTLKQ